MKTIVFIPIICVTLARLGAAEPLFTQTGDDAPFAEVMGSGKLPKGSNSKQGVTGSKINVTNKLVELTPEATSPSITAGRMTR